MKKKKTTRTSTRTIAVLPDVHANRTTTKQKIDKVRQFAQQCHYEQGHSEQVLRLSEILFTKLTEMHGLGFKALFLLKCAAILHDIGWIEGQAGHHKITLRMILEENTLPLTEVQRKMTALIARYHRKALPKPNHAVYRYLSATQQRQVLILGGILRVADGLDRSHMSIVEDIDVRICKEIVEFRCMTHGPALPELLAAQNKADLVEKIFGCKTRFILKSSVAPINLTPSS